MEEYLGDISLDGEQSVQSSGSNTQLAYCAPDKMTKFSRLSQYGMTYKPLTENLGEELLKSSLGAFHVRTFPLQEKEMDLTESDQECGNKWLGSFAKWDQSTSLWRTHQCSFLGDLEPFSETYPQWGLMRNGELWEQKTLVQTTKGTESGLWLTPTVMDGLPARNPEALERQYQNNRKGRTTHSTLREQVVYPPPKIMFPTPCATDYKGAGQTGLLRDRLDYAAERGATKSKTFTPPTILGGQLNPDWVEWLMNWPIKWSDLNGFNKQEFQRWQEASAASIQGIGQMRTMWWDSDPSQTPPGQQPVEQSKQEHSNSLPEMSWDASCERKMERSQQGSDLSLLRKDFYIQKTERKDLQQRMREQTCLDEAQIVPRVSKSVAARVDRLKAIGNGQVPLCAATAWRILNGL